MYLILNSFDSAEIVESFSSDTYVFSMKKNKIHLYNQKMIDCLIKKEFYPDFDKLCKKVLLFLEGDDDDSEDGSKLFVELEKIHDLFLKKYADYVSKREYNKFLNKLRILTNELKLRSFNKISSVRFRR